ncbi:Stk1 family PASTA domain-containing Ser/Thr kinase [Arthrobacter sp. zg-Y820]|uniref:Stk1 family PASTA domain-containing Ser/Thr kinase n=1 Tax=unclassified Arthrobacter TaxID=235627 RepID=UPI001E5D4373|nr:MULTISPECIES: Stk1 family PASTA domain-containing Ser/Thr kinase [unclassified Arthrobacter]MCC9197387.1 Stk1 family PASTA domain-containing Ser/Thr kinase [Arthrobacter sp. zg-Y820]MDK1280253.1 Stk1 family PASTA domain-containing Ser/Thr kinase [Arthrobacter sp. zg.Y820]WIB09542.1 Stk1 family PASTA domain-containing Ser/Thr kinase [Arthrobacter sp. zg-Y820]
MSADFLKGQPTLNTERVLNGRYELGELIGRGGMADVYLGRDIRLGRSVAIKVLRPDLARDPLFQSRFRREAQAVAGLNHPAIVSVYDTGDQESPGSTPDDVRLPFIVMEFVRGRTLRDLVKAGEITTDKAIEYMLGVLAALEYSHRSGIVHRDIKPANVMVTADGGVKVMDFGIARAMADSAATMTQTQAVIGTAQYLSPEQARGETVDARSDLYSAACLLFEMLAGRPPFIGDSPVSVAYQHVREPPPKASSFNAEIAAELDAVLDHGLAKDRADRYQDAHAFRDALLRVRSGAAAVEPAPDTSATEALTVSAPARAAVDVSPIEDEPRTRAMARVRSGGPLTTAPDGNDDDDAPASLSIGNTGDRDPEQKARRRAWITTVCIGLLLLLGAGSVLAFNLINPKETAPVTAVMPDVQSKTQTDALNIILDAGFGPPTIEPEYSDTVKSGLAIGTSPEGGTDAPLDANVTLFISQGPSTVTIPANLAGMTEPEARDALRSLGLQGGTTAEANSSVVPAGRVLSTTPGLGEAVPVETTVDLVLSTGNVTVPDLLGRSLEDAQAILADPLYGLTVTVNEVEDAVTVPGTVTAQSITGGMDVEQGSTIALTVAKAPPEPTEEPTPDPSASPEPSETAKGKKKKDD